MQGSAGKAAVLAVGSATVGRDRYRALVQRFTAQVRCWCGRRDPLGWDAACGLQRHKQGKREEKRHNSLPQECSSSDLSCYRACSRTGLARREAAPNVRNKTVAQNPFRFLYFTPACAPAPPASPNSVRLFFPSLTSVRRGQVLACLVIVSCLVALSFPVCGGRRRRLRVIIDGVKQPELLTLWPAAQISALRRWRAPTVIC